MRNTRIAEALRLEMKDIKYQYEKTGLYDYAVQYHTLADKLLSMGEKPAHLPLLRKQGL